jgi:hypothetical protein
MIRLLEHPKNSLKLEFGEEWKVSDIIHVWINVCKFFLHTWIMFMVWDVAFSIPFFLNAKSMKARIGQNLCIVEHASQGISLSLCCLLCLFESGL